MGEPITIHDPTNWIFLYGTLSVQGFGDGDAISLEPPTELVKAKRGVMGEYALALVTDKLMMLKINLHQTAITSRALRSFFRAQYVPGFIVPQPGSLSNRITGERYSGVLWLVNEGPLKIGPEVQNVEWPFGFHVDNYSG